MVFCDSIPATANIYSNTAFLNLTSNVWTTGPSLTTARYYHTCSLVTLASGEKEIVVVGGYNDNQGPYLNEVSKIFEFFDPLPHLSAFRADLQHIIHITSLTKSSHCGRHWSMAPTDQCCHRQLHKSQKCGNYQLGHQRSTCWWVRRFYAFSQSLYNVKCPIGRYVLFFSFTEVPVTNGGWCTVAIVPAQQPVEHFKSTLQNITTDQMLHSVVPTFDWMIIPD